MCLEEYSECVSRESNRVHVSIKWGAQHSYRRIKCPGPWDAGPPSPHRLLSPDPLYTRPRHGDCSHQSRLRPGIGAGASFGVRLGTLCHGVLARSGQERVSGFLCFGQIESTADLSSDLLWEFEAGGWAPMNCTDLHCRGSYTFNAKFWLGSIATMASTQPGLPGRTM